MYILDYSPVIINDLDYKRLSLIENSIKNGEIINRKDLYYLLDCFIYLTRYNINSNMNDFTNMCDLVQSIVCIYLSKLNVSVFPCQTQKVITNNICGHSFIVARFKLQEQGEVNILIDPTYIQFFKKDKCNKSNYFISSDFNNKVLLTPDPGYFIKDKDKQIALRLNNHGYIELNNSSARMYGDSFYNTKVGEIDTEFKTIPGNIYINSFLNGDENLSYNEEKLIKLGYDVSLFCEKKQLGR